MSTLRKAVTKGKSAAKAIKDAMPGRRYILVKTLKREADEIPDEAFEDEGVDEINAAFDINEDKSNQPPCDQDFIHEEGFEAEPDDEYIYDELDDIPLSDDFEDEIPAKAVKTSKTLNGKISTVVDVLTFFVFIITAASVVILVVGAAITILFQGTKGLARIVNSIFRK